ncbi:metal ABC transporter ATP-binding protein [Thiovibrio frasassiensis]|uniref:ABC transporter ATP-binding protein n=1 Tax=Thiovibrio frasassiensis TaxID=2984131 RepID=A0A9X4RQV5_9BACT|nr:ABC transporter ATP-binding protein [Thiovibrio frasassiensis]MDG4476632.1 ABC transporter ATP-binding protein [Thiovibrio frasassiensis]
MTASREQETAIRIRDLDFAYNGTPVLEGVNLEIMARDSLCIVGPNGGGKTTLLKLILGLLKPNRGEIQVLGQTPEKSRLRIGYVPQYARFDQQFPVTVLNVVLMGRLDRIFCGPYAKADREAALAALEEMGLADLGGRLFAEISGGQRQRVLIARALAAEGELLILDEPTANIDAASEEHLFELLTKLNERLTVMLVTHDVGFASKFFKSIVCVNRQVVLHPTSELTGDLIRNMYGGDIRMIRHDHRCSPEGHCAHGIS